jgi:hypothetical protein
MRNVKALPPAIDPASTTRIRRVAPVSALLPDASARTRQERREAVDRQSDQRENDDDGRCECAALVHGAIVPTVRDKRLV